MGVPDWRTTWLVLLALLALLTLGRLPLIDEDEGEYGEVAMEMARSGDAFAPTLNAQPFYEKPVLLFWQQAPLVRLLVPLGAPVEFALRLPALCASVVWLLALMSFWRARHGLVLAQHAVWLAATSLGVVVVARAAAMDALVNALLALTLFDLWRWLESGARRPLRRAAMWAALGMLAKGPVAWVIPGAVLVAYLGFTPPARARLRDLADPLAWLILLGVSMPWYGWYAWHSEGAFVTYFFGRENVGRLGGSLQGHSGGYGYYLAVLPLLLLPYTAVLAWLPPRVRGWWAEPAHRFLLLWFALVFLIFTLAGTKLPHYLLYGCTPLFLLAAPALAGRLASVWLALPGVLLPALALALPSIAARMAAHDHNPYLRELLARAPLVLDGAWQARVVTWAAAAVLLLVVTIWAALQAPPGDGPTVRGCAVDGAHAQPAGQAWCLTRLLGWNREGSRAVLAWAPGLVSALGVSLVLLPAVTGLQQDPVRRAARMAASLQQPVVSDDRMPSFSVYLGAATQVRPVRAGDLAFGRLDHPDRLGTRFDTLFAEGGIRVVRVRAP